jgi:FAD/FMN-containing dehydrogenase
VEDGLVIDVRPLDSIAVDPVKREARVGAGSRGDTSTQRKGARTRDDRGRVTTTGVAGYTLGGGNGWLDRTFGLAVDNLLSVDLVTADGHLVTASADEHPELFWALRGGGGNFGVATSFRFLTCSTIASRPRGRPGARGSRLPPQGWVSRCPAHRHRVRRDTP